MPKILGKYSQSRRKAGSLSFSGLITIISILMVVNIYISIYSIQFFSSAIDSIIRDLIYAESAMCFVALISLVLWFRMLRSRLFSLVDAAREMISTDKISTDKSAPEQRAPVSHEGIFVEMSEISKHMRELHDRMKYFETLSGSISTMLDSLGQGILVVTPDGICSEFHSKACEDLFEASPSGMALADLLKIPAQDREAFDAWLKLLFAESIAFVDLADLAPKMFAGSKGRQITLELKPIRNTDGLIEGTLLIATDRTREFESELRATQNREKVKMILTIAQNHEMFRVLIKKCRELVAELRSIRSGAVGSETLQQLARSVHTIKGSAGVFFMAKLVQGCHEFEADLKDAKLSQSDQLAPRLEQFAAGFEAELNSIVLNYSDLIGPGFESDGPMRAIPLQSLLEFHSFLDPALNADRESLHSQFLAQFICVSIREVISGFNGRTQQLAQKLGKEIAPAHFSGVDVKIYKEANEDVFFNLIHIFNNIVDHGVESPAERAKSGKPTVGNVKVDVQASIDKNGLEWVEIRISDDGRGVDPAKVRKKLESLGKLHPAESDFEVIQHIFDTDLSTRDETTELSGRGVGLNALKTAVSARGGTILVSPSNPYGTTFLIRLPAEQVCGWTGQHREDNVIAA